MLETSNLSFAYQGTPSMSFPDVHLGGSSSMLITGPSGIGKSTFLKLIAGFIPASSGTIKIAGKQLDSGSPKQRDRVRQEHIGVIAQQPRSFEALTVDENLNMVHYLTSTRRDQQRINELLETLGISQYSKTKPASLSIGEQQRLAIAMACVHKPDLILADEPTSGLDSANCDHVLDLLRNQVEAIGAALIIISHDDRLIGKFENRLEL